MPLSVWCHTLENSLKSSPLPPKKKLILSFQEIISHKNLPEKDVEEIRFFPQKTSADLNDLNKSTSKRIRS
jgi:hypothetical protein